MADVSIINFEVLEGRSETVLQPEQHLLAVGLQEVPDEDALGSMAAFLAERYFVGASLGVSHRRRRDFKDECDFRQLVGETGGGTIDYLSRGFSRYVLLFSGVHRAHVALDVARVQADEDLPRCPATLNAQGEVAVGNVVVDMVFDRSNVNVDPEEPDLSLLETTVRWPAHPGVVAVTFSAEHPRLSAA